MKMAKSNTKKNERPVEELTYEEALAELEGIVEALETGQNALEDSMKMFERGQALVSRCNGLLETAQLRVQKLAGDQLLPFEEDAE
jgi:exodeoxyribonuclease VII small subunit